MDKETVTLVTAVFIDDDHVVGAHSTYVGRDQALAECIEEAKREALDDFTNGGGSPVHRIVVNVTTLPLPCIDDMPHVEIKGESSEVSAPVTVTSTLS